MSRTQGQRRHPVEDLVLVREGISVALSFGTSRGRPHPDSEIEGKEEWRRRRRRVSRLQSYRRLAVFFRTGVVWNGSRIGTFSATRLFTKMGTTPKLQISKLRPECFQGLARRVSTQRTHARRARTLGR